MAQTISDVDAELLLVRERYLAAEEACDMLTAGRLYRLLDDLLDIRLHLPQQRAS